MSTLKVDTIQPNANDRVFVSSTLEVDGAQVLVNNALNVGGNASITGSLSAATLTSNGTIAANGNVTGVSNLDCSTIVATGSINSSSISSGTGAFSGAVSSGSPGKNLFRPALCGTLKVGDDTTTPVFASAARASGPASQQWPSDGWIWDNNANLSIATPVGSPSASWVTINTYKVARITWPGTISNNYARLVTAIFQTELGTYTGGDWQPIYTWGGTNLDIWGFAGTFPYTTAAVADVRFHFWIDFPNVYSVDP